MSARRQIFSPPFVCLPFTDISTGACLFRSVRRARRRIDSSRSRGDQGAAELSCFLPPQRPRSAPLLAPERRMQIGRQLIYLLERRARQIKSGGAICPIGRALGSRPKNGYNSITSQAASSPTNFVGGRLNSTATTTATSSGNKWPRAPNPERLCSGSARRGELPSVSGLYSLMSNKGKQGALLVIVARRFLSRRPLAGLARLLNEPSLIDIKIGLSRAQPPPADAARLRAAG